MQEEQPLQVARCTKIIPDERDQDKSKYVINVKQIAKFVVNLGERVSPTDIEEGMRVGLVAVVLLLNIPMLTPPKCRPKQVSDYASPTAEDRPLGHHDDCRR